MGPRIDIRIESDSEYGQLFERDLRYGRLLAPAPETRLEPGASVQVTLRTPQGKAHFSARVEAPEIRRPAGVALGLSFPLSLNLLLQLRGLCVSDASALALATTSGNPALPEQATSDAAPDNRAPGEQADARDGAAGLRRRARVTGNLPQLSGPTSTAHDVASGHIQHGATGDASAGSTAPQTEQGQRTAQPGRMVLFTPAHGLPALGAKVDAPATPDAQPGPEVIRRFAERQRHAPQHSGGEALRVPRENASSWPPGLPAMAEFRRAHDRTLSPWERAEFLDRIHEFLRRARPLEPFDLLGLGPEASPAAVQQVYARYCAVFAAPIPHPNPDPTVVRLRELVFECLHRNHEELMRRIRATGKGYTPPQGYAVVPSATPKVASDPQPRRQSAPRQDA